MSEYEKVLAASRDKNEETLRKMTGKLLPPEEKGGIFVGRETSKRLSRMREGT